MDFFKFVLCELGLWRFMRKPKVGETWWFPSTTYEDSNPYRPAEDGKITATVTDIKRNNKGVLWLKYSLGSGIFFNNETVTMQKFMGLFAMPPNE